MRFWNFRRADMEKTHRQQLIELSFCAWRNWGPEGKLIFLRSHSKLIAEPDLEHHSLILVPIFLKNPTENYSDLCNKYISYTPASWSCILASTYWNYICEQG
jgi:hypothetical protein